jgi:pilus assembly protein CpaF
MNSELLTDVSLEKKLRDIELEGFGPIAPFLEDPLITEILIDSFSKIFIEKEGKLQKTDSHFSDEHALNRFLKRLLRDIDRTVDMRHPLVDGTLGDGTRVHIAHPPITTNPIISMRRHSKTNWSLSDLSKNGMFSEKILLKLREKIEQRFNVLICGATGCGKTTLLRSLIYEISSQERVITVEDTSELALTRENSVSLLTRISLEGLFPSISLNDLLKNALRMRPDRLVVGEIRSEEALVFLDAVSTGHTGSMSSIHGSSASQALSRLEHLVSREAPQWSMDSIRKLIYEGVDLVIVLERKNKSRQVREVVELAGLESFGYLFDPWPLT